jgi:tRNA dimethylallyltransferase
LDIGTGKPSMADRERVRHHLIDLVNPDQEFNAAMFRHLASEVIYQIDERERNAIVCGGTGLYLKALTRGLFEGPAQDSEIRRSLEKEIAESGLNSLYRRLAEIDPTVNSTIHPHDRLGSLPTDWQTYQSMAKGTSFRGRVIRSPEDRLEPRAHRTIRPHQSTK